MNFRKLKRKRNLHKKSAIPVDQLLDKAFSLFQQKQTSEAISILKKVVSQQPDNPDHLSDLGNMLRQSGQLTEAVSYFRKAIKIDQSHWVALNNLAISLEELGSAGEAAEILKKIISIRPDHPEPYCNLANLYTDLGDLDSAIELFESSLAVDPLFSPSLMGLINAKMYMGDFTSWYKSIETALRKGKLEFAEKNELYVYSAIYAWLRGDLSKVLTSLENIKDNSRLTKNVLAYRNLLSKIATHQFQIINPVGTNNQTKLHILGDSHSLPPANKTVVYHGTKYFCQSHLIMGCKAWHLANENNNNFKAAIIRTLENISSPPSMPSVLFMFGEIDCRLDEGIYYHHKKHNVPLEEVVTKTVLGYSDFIREICSMYKLSPIICGVPAPNLNQIQLNSSEIPTFLTVTKLFNEKLRNIMLDIKVEFLDVYNATKNDQLTSNKKYHIDEHHLSPDFLQIGIDHYLM